MTENNVSLVVVGGGPAGHSAAAGYRDAGGLGPVEIISADPARPYDRPPLSKDFLRGESEQADLPMADEAFYGDRQIELRLDESVLRMDLSERTLLTSAGRPLRFDRCVLATGSTPTPLSVPGAETVHYLRSVQQAVALRQAAETARRAVVIGSGFIGCEAAASLALRGIDVTMVTTERSPQLTRLGPEAAERIAGWLTNAGVHIVTSEKVEEIRVDQLVLTGGGVLDPDLILAATGVTPNSHLAADAGLAVQDGRIVVDAHLRTEVPGVFAAGDVALAHHPVAGRRLAVEHWGDALTMGEAAGMGAAGTEAQWSAVPGFWSNIGGHQLKYAAWGDGYERAELVDHPHGGFTVRYTRAGDLVGVLTYEADDDYDEGMSAIAAI